MPERGAFKRCAYCGYVWENIRDFIADSSLHVNGYQAAPEDPQRGLIMVTHEVEGCGNTLAVRASELSVLYDGPTHQERMIKLEPCRLLCLDSANIEECKVECDLAWVRQVLQHLRRHELPQRVQESAAH